MGNRWGNREAVEEWGHHVQRSWGVRKHAGMLCTHETCRSRNCVGWCEAAGTDKDQPPNPCDPLGGSVFIPRSLGLWKGFKQRWTGEAVTWSSYDMRRSLWPHDTEGVREKQGFLVWTFPSAGLWLNSLWRFLKAGSIWPLLPRAELSDTALFGNSELDERGGIIGPRSSLESHSRKGGPFILLLPRLLTLTCWETPAVLSREPGPEKRACRWDLRPFKDLASNRGGFPITGRINDFLPLLCFPLLVSFSIHTFLISSCGVFFVPTWRSSFSICCKAGLVVLNYLLYYWS